MNKKLLDGILDMAFDVVLNDNDDNKYIWEPIDEFMEELKPYLSDKAFMELDGRMGCCANEAFHRCGVVALKCAVGIVDGTYVATL